MTIPKPGPTLGTNPIKEEEELLGDRSTRNGGYWAWCRDWPANGCTVKAEIFHELKAIEGLERIVVEASWNRLVKQATKGSLRFGDHEDVSIIKRVPDLLELRLQVHPSHEDVEKRYLLRLYFAEPPPHDRLMLGLKFGRKPGDGDPSKIQDLHIDQARDRYDDGMKNNFQWGIELQ